ncbi:MAG: hypothetical protein KJ893_04665 [Candidatus Omnitrophica bacterium]|nr:hypothetical protein [Candidatus Omnitrophota bacterium]MBU4478022.1 hypothetical protein [Candidatus Omnitrophota bacterium]MCG2703630.1 hypothetical protein [Candidatus Omnitrophota bacterium]
MADYFSRLDRQVKDAIFKIAFCGMICNNKGYRKYVTTEGGRYFVIDEEKIKEEACYDGKWILTTNTTLPTAEVALKCKQLWQVKDAILDNKNNTANPTDLSQM